MSPSVTEGDKDHIKKEPAPHYLHYRLTSEPLNQTHIILQDFKPSRSIEANRIKQSLQ